MIRPLVHEFSRAKLRVVLLFVCPLIRVFAVVFPLVYKKSQVSNASTASSRNIRLQCEVINEIDVYRCGLWQKSPHNGQEVERAPSIGRATRGVHIDKLVLQSKVFHNTLHTMINTRRRTQQVNNNKIDFPCSSTKELLCHFL